MLNSRAILQNSEAVVRVLFIQFECAFLGYISTHVYNCGDRTFVPVCSRLLIKASQASFNVSSVFSVRMMVTLVPSVLCSLLDRAPAAAKSVGGDSDTIDHCTSRVTSSSTRLVTVCLR
jgi:hypothetical protein